MADVGAYLAEHERKDMLRLLTCGSVDDGKSTLIGRLLHDSKLVYDDQLAAARQDSKRFGTTGDDVDLALLVDGLQAEREQGITIDVAHRYFSTSRRKFIIADTPGHEQYTRNMATGASTSDLAVILVDARKGVLIQTRRHTTIVSLLGIRHVIVAVNKMDLVEYRQEVFEAIRAEYGAFAAKLGVPDVRYVPISALKGDNVVHRSERMPWYRGTALMGLLEEVPVAADWNLADFRFPVQIVLRPNLDFRGLGGTIASGVIRPGDPVMALPSRRTSRIKSIETWGGKLSEAYPPMAVTLVLQDEIDVARGDVLVDPGRPPAVEGGVEATVVWMAEEPMRPGKQYLVKHGTKLLPGRVESIRNRLDVNSLAEEPAQELKLNEIGRCLVELSQPVPFDPYSKNRQMGAFILIDRMTNNTVGAGMILQSAPARFSPAPAGSEGRISELSIPGRKGPVTTGERVRRLGHKPATIVLVGRGSAARARALERRLFDRGCAARAIRAQGARRAAEAAKLLNGAGLIAIAAFDALLTQDRRMFRKIVGSNRTLLAEESFSADRLVELLAERGVIGRRRPS